MIIAKAKAIASGQACWGLRKPGLREARTGGGGGGWERGSPAGEGAWPGE